MLVRTTRLSAAVMAATLAAQSLAQPLGGGGPMPAPGPGECVSDADRKLAADLIAQFERNFGPRSRSSGEPPPKLTFYPLAGRAWRDLFLFNFVDINSTSAYGDWDCTNWSYDGHNGSDNVLRSFGEQLVGVPVFAAQDGTVIATHDGEDDMNTTWAGQPSNFVILDHGNGRESWYLHLKKNSVVVTPGQPVYAGHQVGLAASSGVSSGPHLHFEIRDNGVVYEPFHGDCNPGDSGWMEQPAIERSPYIHDFGITHQAISTSWPNRWPTTGQIALTDANVKVWWYGTALPTTSNWQVRFKRPDGTTGFSSGTQSFTNPFWRWYNWWWTYDPFNAGSPTGTWHVELYVNGALMVNAPLEVVATRIPNFNRRPEAITAELEPPDPMDGDVLSCLINTSLVLDDVDYDLVKYEYVWTVNGKEVRHVTTAAHSDVLARNFVEGGSQVRCTVTPTDGIQSGVGGMATTTVRSGIPATSSWGALVLTLLLTGAATVILSRRSADCRSHGANAALRSGLPGL